MNKLIEKNEEIKDRIICSCGNYEWTVYISVIIDDARIYCTKCKKEWTED